MGRDAPLGQSRLECRLGFQGTGGDTAGGHADMNLRQRALDEGILPGPRLVEEGLVGRSDRAVGIRGHERAAFLSAFSFRSALSSSVSVCVMGFDSHR